MHARTHTHTHTFRSGTPTLRTRTRAVEACAFPSLSHTLSLSLHCEDAHGSSSHLYQPIGNIIHILVPTICPCPRYRQVDYSVVPPVVSLVASHAGQHSVGLGVGILLAWHSGAAALGAAIGGYIYDRDGDYSAALHLCAALCFAAAIIVLGVCPEPLLRRPAADGAGAVDDVKAGV